MILSLIILHLRAARCCGPYGSFAPIVMPGPFSTFLGFRSTARGLCRNEHGSLSHPATLRSGQWAVGQVLENTEKRSSDGEPGGAFAWGGNTGPRVDR